MCFLLIKVHLLVSELYMYQNARCNDKKKKTVEDDLLVSVSKKICSIFSILYPTNRTH
jgi:hypothetical protein